MANDVYGQNLRDASGRLTAGEAWAAVYRVACSEGAQDTMQNAPEAACANVALHRLTH